MCGFLCAYSDESGVTRHNMQIVFVKVLVPQSAVGVVIGKGGDMIKKIQAETGARVQFHQLHMEAVGDRRSVPFYVAGLKKSLKFYFFTFFNIDN